MIYSLYRSLTLMSTPVIELYLRQRLKKGKEDPARAFERRGRPLRARPAGALVWLHAASVGEALSVLSLVDRLLQNHKDLSVMLTTGTVTSAKLMAERLPRGAFHQYMPVDHPKWVARFLDHWRPDLVLWTESEYWPNMLFEIKKRAIPTALINARLSEKSFQRWSKAPTFAKNVLSVFDVCLAQNQAEADRLKSLGARGVKVSGNLKYAAKPLPYDEARLEKLQQAFKARPLCMLASSHAGEEEIAMACHAHLAQKIPGLLTLIVPRHPQRAQEIMALARAQGLKAAQRSVGRLPSVDDDLYIADTMGELGLLFKVCPVVVMGGSFVPHGGHNPIEPAQFGCAILYGPHMFNFLSVCADFEAAQAALPQTDPQMLEQTLERLLNSDVDRVRAGTAALNFAKEKARGLDVIINDLAPVLENLPHQPAKAVEA